MLELLDRSAVCYVLLLDLDQCPKFVDLTGPLPEGMLIIGA